MTHSRAENLINKLIANKISGEELGELLEGLKNEDEQQKYSDALEIYFDRLLKENEGNQKIKDQEKTNPRKL
ncbi:hypothetical protein [Dyadobacter sp. CY356]|uniref:hypothetical protein n=1 Tax=Dyadobacter sp. CY356 TaxID=2906442 RepID=UPI001F231DDC|nr:hypothetical protein [Dyadobacter sp. CY356]MCF0058443.1 hypothetical protein [Dyadobacter sp. CY356]